MMVLLGMMLLVMMVVAVAVVVVPVTVEEKVRQADRKKALRWIERQIRVERTRLRRRKRKVKAAQASPHRPTRDGQTHTDRHTDG